MRGWKEAFPGGFGEHKQVFMNVINTSNRKVVYEQYNVDKTNTFLQNLFENNTFK